MATAVALTMGVASANVQLGAINSNLQGYYTGLGGVITDYSGTDEVFGSGGMIENVTTGANAFVDAFRNVSGAVSFDADTWTLSNSLGTGVGTLEDARDSLRASESALMSKVQSDLIGDGSVANHAGAAHIATVISQGGLLGKLTASIQVEAEAFTGQVVATDVQSLYEQDGALDAFLSVTGLAASSLQTRVNSTRQSVANVRDGFVVDNTAIDSNTGSIVADSSDNSLTASVLTNSTNTHIKVSDYCTDSTCTGSVNPSYTGSEV